MTKPLVISLDGMGGDNAPEIVVEGAALARAKLPQASFLLYGDQNRLKPLVDAQPLLKGCVDIRHTDQAVAATDKPSVALRTGRKSSMRLAIDAVRNGEADGVVSAGNTGALMAMAMFGLRTLPGIDRPAIVSTFPTLNGASCMLDLGANVECDADNLVQFAVMGEVFARTVMGIQNPTVALLNVGTEELKGKDEVKLAATMLRDTDLPIVFKGFVEGDDIGKGTVDVIVTDGYTGNIALKTAEGTAALITGFLKDAFSSSIFAKLGYLLAAKAMGRLRKRVDPRHYNGAVFVGLNGIAVKSHGGTDAYGFSNAIGVAAEMAANNFIARMRDDFEQLKVGAVENGHEKSVEVSSNQ
ncbi:phosphate acyltransferase PlsX [Aestuariispira insulae]|uniref:Phosphate acyltransferase n=1 Tax=Aestuariispira insulae TaxID=1461337 RepID=A0A3D9HWT3_9PROT|nr:phosphate acyltransferase PlsX [Aestuariispira insulae]RED53366.1 phosphate:acyl-[acyl carrier protein] acyltransferase [Aestuariispira insulae]